MINTFVKVRQIKTSQSEKMNYVTTSFVKQWLFCLKEELDEILEEKKIKDLIKKYSKFFGHPIN
jgi:HSP90 family molecular chaperone